MAFLISAGNGLVCSLPPPADEINLSLLGKKIEARVSVKCYLSLVTMSTRTGRQNQKVEK